MLGKVSIKTLHTATRLDMTGYRAKDWVSPVLSLILIWPSWSKVQAEGVCSWILLASSQIVTKRLIVDYESSDLAKACPTSA